MFCEEYAKERNRLLAAATNNRGFVEKELAKVKKDHAKLLDAIIAGVPADQVKDKMIALDTRRIELETQLDRNPAPSPIRIHPKMAETYRDNVTTLIRQLQEPDVMLEAKDALCGLIDRIVLHPTKPDGKFSIHLEGALAQLLILSLEFKNNQGPSRKAQAIDCIE